eukprot:TRINITY_DN9260_c0_g2_i2.p1 TRINITY_DN9260_c0_g2~~TRINITY_DN9260_c0_g2_i2.p1  ORF type:complete len:959 (-),score=141.09 TRINITY_DN9260_c0_g2_i2:533-3388(-)
MNDHARTVRILLAGDRLGEREALLPHMGLTLDVGAPPAKGPYRRVINVEGEPTDVCLTVLEIPEALGATSQTLAPDFLRLCCTSDAFVFVFFTTLPDSVQSMETVIDALKTTWGAKGVMPLCIFANNVGKGLPSRSSEDACRRLSSKYGCAVPFTGHRPDQTKLADAMVPMMIEAKKAKPTIEAALQLQEPEEADFLVHMGTKISNLKTLVPRRKSTILSRSRRKSGTGDQDEEGMAPSFVPDHDPLATATTMEPEIAPAAFSMTRMAKIFPAVISPSNRYSVAPVQPEEPPSKHTQQESTTKTSRPLGPASRMFFDTPPSSPTASTPAQISKEPLPSAPFRRSPSATLLTNPTPQPATIASLVAPPANPPPTPAPSFSPSPTPMPTSTSLPPSSTASTDLSKLLEQRLAKKASPQPIGQFSRANNGATATTDAPKTLHKKSASTIGIARGQYTARDTPKRDNEYIIAVLGDIGCGKTTFVKNVVESFPDNQRQSPGGALGDDTESYQLVLPHLNGPQRVHVVMPQAERNLAYRIGVARSDAFLVMFNVTSRTSFFSVPKIINYLMTVKNDPHIPILIVGTKSDDVNARVVSREEGSKLSSSQGCHYIEGSGKTGLNTMQSLAFLLGELIHYSGQPSNLPTSPLQSQTSATDLAMSSNLLASPKSSASNLHLGGPSGHLQSRSHNNLLSLAGSSNGHNDVPPAVASSRHLEVIPASPESAGPPKPTRMADQIASKMCDPNTGVMSRAFKRSAKNPAQKTFTGAEATEWIQLNLVSNLSDALAVGQSLIDAGLLLQVTATANSSDEKSIFQNNEDSWKFKSEEVTVLNSRPNPEQRTNTTSTGPTMINIAINSLHAHIRYKPRYGRLVVRYKSWTSTSQFEQFASLSSSFIRAERIDSDDGYDVYLALCCLYLIYPSHIVVLHSSSTSSMPLLFMHVLQKVPPQTKRKENHS